MAKNEKELENMKKLQREIDELKDNMKEYAEDLSEDGKKAFRELQKKLREKHEELMERYSPVLEKYKDSGREMVRNVEEKIAERPLAALLLAFGAGIVIGKLCRRHRY